MIITINKKGTDTYEVLKPNKIKAIKNKEDMYEIYYEEELLSKIELKLKRDSYLGRIIEKSDNELKIQIITYAPLHTHTGMSLLDGAIRIGDLAKEAPYYCAITDHGAMYGFLDFYKSMNAQKKYPIIGFEAYAEDFSGNKEGYHLLLLAKNNVGLKNLIKLTSKAFDNFYRKPQVSAEMLKEHSEGVIATTACLGGLIPHLILENKLDEAEKALFEYKKIFGEDFYIELQRHGIEGEEIIEPALINLAKKHNLKLIATADSHYLKEDDAYSHEILLCLQTKKTISEDHFKFDGTGYHFMSCEEMEDLFSDMPEILDNTLEIAEKCKVELELNNINMPNYEIPEKFTSKTEYFEYLCKKGFNERFGGTEKYTSQEYLDRFNYEIEMIKKMNFEEYFLIVWDFIDYAKKHDIAVGPGRGSVVGSLVAYCLHITDIDPIPYDLLFERFLNPERVSWPDIDTDFDYNRRAEVFSYLKNKYGEDNVCKIITFGTEGAKMVVRDVSRVLGNPSLGNKIAKLIPEDPKMTLIKALNNPELKDMYTTDSEVKNIIDISMKLEGLPRQTSVHACGFVISSRDVTENLPTAITLNKDTKIKEKTSQVVMSEVEELGLLKMDLLGLRTMSVISNSFKLIEKNHGKKYTMSDVLLDDRDVYKYLKEGNTSGVFQFESAGMTSLLGEMYQDIETVEEKNLPQMFERLIAAVALYRPGPMDYIPDYIKNMKDINNIRYDYPTLEPILKNTYGVIVYQEQVMKMVQKLAGYTLGRADIVRKAMGKKKIDIMEKEEKVFIYGNLDDDSDKVKVKGCIANGIPEETAKFIWDKMAKFAEYAFNKPHAAAYAYLAYITAWLSYHYPLEFNVSLLNSVLDKADKLAEYLSACYKRNIAILPPEINHSEEEFKIEDDKIRFGLLGIKSINKSGADIINERKNGPFKDLQDFTQRLGKAGSINKKLYEALVFSGAVDCFKGTRRAKIESTEMLMKNAAMWNKVANSDQMSLFDLSNDYVESMAINIPELPEYADIFMLKKEKEFAGFYLSGHPLDNYTGRLKALKSIYSVEKLLSISSVSIKRDVETAGLITNIRTFWTKNGDQIYNFDLEDRFHSINCVVFSDYLPLNKINIIEDNAVVIKGSLQESPDWGTQIIVKDIFSIDTYLKTNVVPQVITVSVNNKEEQDKLFSIIRNNKGDDTSIVIFAKNKNYPLKDKIKYSPKVITLLKDNFVKVVAS
ncbi:MAG TPA: DNA polymerase III subunit alpha [Clostridiales bacterium]|nr:DNA polymerase III subunit alpha [Clostridiales bacterium]